MKNVLVLDFNDDCTLEEIKEEMEFYQENCQVVMTTINGIKVFSNDPQFDQIFERLSLNLTEEQYKELKHIERNNKNLEKMIDSANNIENVEHFRFYYGLAKTLIKPDKIDDFEIFINCSEESDIKDLILATQIMLAMEQESQLQIYREINKIISTIRLRVYEDEINLAVTLNNALRLVRNFAIKGELIDDIFFKGTTLDYKNKILKQIQNNNQQIEKIKKRK